MEEATSRQILVRGKDGISILIGAPKEVVPRQPFDKLVGSKCEFSTDGRLLAFDTTKEVCIYNVESGKKVASVPAAGIVALALSPKGSFLQTFQRPNGQEKNLAVWDVKSGAVVFQTQQKQFSKSSWPSVQFSDDETVACRAVTNEAHLYDTRDWSKGIVDRLRAQGLGSVQLAASPASHLAAYFPEAKGAPANVRVFERGQVATGQAVARRSFFRSSSARFFFNRGSSAVLVLAASEVDKTNQSYYGESSLHYLSCDGANECGVPLSKEGPIHDVQWSPTGSMFVVVHGFMPAKATLFDAKCKPIFDFGSGAKNTARWNPQGRFLCLAGFGNLPGDMEFWDCSKLKSLGKAKAPCSVTCEWSPDGRLVMTATTAPRLQVDNGIKIFKYDGTLLLEKPFDVLYQADWRPAPEGTYEDRPPSPKTRKAEAGASEAAAVSPGGAATPKKPAAQPAAYRHPNATQDVGRLATLLGGSDKPRKLGVPERNVPPGAPELSKNALRNKKRREKKKGESGDADGEPTSEAVEQVAVQVASVQSPSSAGGEEAESETGKKIRALQKKLRQIEDLKKKADAAGGVEALPPPQREKLAQEAALRQEVDELERTK